MLWSREEDVFIIYQVWPERVRVRNKGVRHPGMWHLEWFRVSSKLPQSSRDIAPGIFLDQKHLCVHTYKSLAERCSCLASAPSHSSQSQPANCSPDVLTLTQRCPLCWEAAANEPLPSLAFPERVSGMIDRAAGCCVSPTTIPNPEKMLLCKRKQMRMGLWEFTKERKLDSFPHFFFH